jgi:hypothetical protein
MIFLGLTSRSTVKHNIKIYKKIIKSIDKKASKAKNGWLNYNERKYIKIQLRNLKKRVKSQSTVFGYSLGDYIFTDAYNAISSGFKATNAKNAAWLKRVNKRILRTLNAI